MAEQAGDQVQQLARGRRRVAEREAAGGEQRPSRPQRCAGHAVRCGRPSRWKSVVSRRALKTMISVKAITTMTPESTNISMSPFSFVPRTFSPMLTGESQ